MLLEYKKIAIDFINDVRRLYFVDALLPAPFFEKVTFFLKNIFFDTSTRIW